MEMMKTKITENELETIEAALGAALTSVAPPKELLGRLQVRIKELKPELPSLIGKQVRPNWTYIGMAGLFTLLMTVAVGFRTSGSIVGAIALMNEMNRQVKSRKYVDLTPTG